MSIFSSPLASHYTSRDALLRFCQTQAEDEAGFSDFFSFPLLSQSPAGFSQMEVAQHSRPALHNLRMKEGGSASTPERGGDGAHK